MGVVISSQSTLAPVSLASTIIGFLSFAFTVATAVRVFWANVQTIVGAASEIEEYLTNLRQSLYEERRHLRKARRHLRKRRNSRPGPDGSGGREKEGGASPEAALQAMQSAVRFMITRFRAVERPFVRHAVHPSHKARKGLDDAYGYSSGGEEEGADYYHCENRYKDCGFRERWVWLKSKSNFVSLAEGVDRITTRRIGMQVNEINIWMRDLGRHFDDFDERLEALDRLEQRMSRVVGVRRVD